MTTGFKDIDGFASAGIIKLRREVISLLEKFAASPPGPSEIIGDGDGGGDHSHLYWELRFLCRYKSRGFEKMVVIPPGVKHWPLRLAVYGHSAMIQLSNNFFQCSYDLTTVCELRGKSETTEIILLLLTLLRRCQVAGLPGEILTRHSASLASHLALLLTRHVRGTNIFRTVYFMPNLIGGVVLGYIWQILLNGVLTLLEKPLLSLNATYGFWGIVILMCWQQIGYMMIIYIAGLQNVPPDLIEAARIDGANNRQVLTRVKIPMVMPSITICTFLTLTNSFKLFDQNLSLTGGEPAKQSQMLALNIYDTFYARSGPQWKGIGQAKAVVFFLAVVIIALVQLRLTRSKEVQQ